MTTAVSAAPEPLVDRLLEGLTCLRTSAPGVQAAQWLPDTREAVISGLDQLVKELTVYRGQVLRAHEQAGTWGSVRDRDFADYRSRTTGAGRGAAVGELQLAEGLAKMPEVSGALERGELNLEHAKALSRLRREASREVRDALDDGGLDALVRRAARDKLTAPDLGKAAKAWAATVDAAAAQADFDAVRRRRSLTMRKSGGGLAGEFFLDPVAGEQLRTAMEAIAGRPAADDDRTREQRMADAMTTAAQRTLQVGADLAGAQVRPHISLLVSEETWLGVLRRRRALEACPDGSRPPLAEVAPGELEDGTVVPLRELERLMCDSEITRTVMNAAGVPLDVGRTQRTFTKELRRAVVTRDRHCQWPGCRLRASWCEVHHITWFSRGGTTCLGEGIALCSFHHHRVHEFDVRITVLADGFAFHYRDGKHIGTTRRARQPGTRERTGGTAPEDSALDPRPPQAWTSDGAPQAWTSDGAPQACTSEAASQECVSEAAPQACVSETAPQAAPASAVPRPPLPPPRNTGPVDERSSALPSLPGSYATAPALWDSDPPF